MDDVKTFLDVLSEAKDAVSERDDVTEAVGLALLSRNHCMLYGKPGTAKSMSARFITGAIKNCQHFAKQLTRQMTEEAVFGPLDIPRWRSKGEYVYQTKGGLAEAEVAVLEEYFDGSDALIRSMNELLNEREFSRSLGNVKKCPLHSAIATSNFFRTEGDAQAVSDRFLVRVEVARLVERSSRVDMIRSFLKVGGQPKPRTTIDFGAIKSLTAKAQNVLVPDDVLDLYEEVATEYSGKVPDVYISDRRIAWASALIQCAAVLDGRNKAVAEDVADTKFGLVFIGRQKEEQAFESVYAKVVGNISARRKSLEDLQIVSDALDHFDKVLKTGDTRVIARKHVNLMDAAEQLESRTAIGDSVVDDKFAEALTRCQTLLAKTKEALKGADLGDALFK